MSIALSNLPALVSSIKSALDHNKQFSFTQDHCVSVAKEKNLSAEEAFENIRILSIDTINLLKTKDLRQIDLSERESLRDLVDVVYRASKVFKNQFGKIQPELASRLHDMALCAKLGGKIDRAFLKKDFVDFIEVNVLQHKIQALGYQMGEEPSLSIEGIEDPVLWSKITKTALVQGSPSDPAFSYSFEGKEIFSTDNKGKLDSDYMYIDGKLAKYNAVKSKEIRAYDHELEAPGRFKIELWTAVKDVEGKRPAVTLGDHTYLVLVDETGARFGVGQYGMAEDFNITHAFSAFGRKKGGVETPDRYLFMPKDSHSFQKTEFIVDKSSFDSVMDTIKGQKISENFSVSLLCRNCSSTSVGLLENIGIKINAKVGFLELLWRKFAPLSLIASVDKILDAWPSSVKKALSYLPIFYIPVIFYGLIVRVLSLKNFNNEPSDISLFDVFFRPWNVTIDHPFAVRRWQEKNSNLNNH